MKFIEIINFSDGNLLKIRSDLFKLYKSPNTYIKLPENKTIK